VDTMNHFHNSDLPSQVSLKLDRTESSPFPSRYHQIVIDQNVVDFTYCGLFSIIYIEGPLDRVSTRLRYCIRRGEEIGLVQILNRATSDLCEV
jgi:hypothetical protein